LRRYNTVLPDIDPLSLCSQMSELWRRRSREAELPDVRPLPLFLMESSEGAGPPRAKVGRRRLTLSNPSGNRLELSA
jgi:hypothetical protein